jgi:hypothetical protein
MNRVEKSECGSQNAEVSKLALHFRFPPFDF